jgi:putative CRISPR-associated protein (TIGR02619 family)
MSRTLLCSIGTSIAQGCKSLPQYQMRSANWEEPTAELSEEIRLRLQSFDLSQEAGRVKSSAELNALHRFGVSSHDEVVLFVTDTADGRACAEAVRDVLSDRFGVTRVTIERVEGLQVRDAERLRRVGLTNLVRRLIHYLDDPQRRFGGGCVLCPNGGFKGVMPFLTLLGMIYRAPVVYVFEFAESLITLPPLPIGFATDLFERALPALRWASDEGVFDPAAFYRLIPGYVPDEQQWFDSFLEIVPDAAGQVMASLSPLAEVLTQREGGIETEMMISTMAREELERLSGPDRKEVNDHLRKLTSALWRSQHRDTKHTNDLDFFPRGHNPWRFGGFVVGGVFHLCWFAKHGEYERRLSLPGMQRQAFPLQQFTAYTVPEELRENPSVVTDVDQGKDWLTLLQERDLAHAELAKAQQELSSLRDLIKTKEGAMRRLRAELDATQRQAQTWSVQSGNSESEEILPAHWIGQVCDAVCLQVKKGSYLLRCTHEGQIREATMPKILGQFFREGESLRVKLTGISGKTYQAAVVIDSEKNP